MENKKIKTIEADAVTQSSITEEQAAFFLEHGFLIVRNVIRDEELKHIQQEMMKLVDQGVLEGKKFESSQQKDPDYLFGKGEKSGTSIFKRVEYVIDKSDAMKILLGNSFILNSVQRLQGVNFIPTWDSMVVKMPDEGIIVPWHRDSEPPYGSNDPRPIFNVDFYLDASDIKSCLWVIPGSHHWSIEKTQERVNREGFDTSDAIPVPINAGDVIFHNIKLIHGSPAGDGNTLRRTVYYEFRPGEVEFEFGPHTIDYLAIKQQVLIDCIKRRQKASYSREEAPFHYSPTGQFAVEQVASPKHFRYAHADYWRTKD